MKQSTFILIGCLSAISLSSGIIGYLFEKYRLEKEKHGVPSTFRDVYDDNAPKPSERSSRELMEEYFEDCGGTYPY